ncbi:LysR family transcriptional regulator [bacterium]|nr:LysR family transcriptional regulator [bacterium]
MDYNQIALFVNVVEAGSLSEAARRMGVAKSNVSRSLTALEKDIGSQLVYRNTRNFHPTEAGINFYNQCKGPMFEVRMAAENLKQDESVLKGKFIITTALDIALTILPPIVAEFSKKYPKLNLEIRAEDRRVDLVQEGVDLAIRMGHLQDSNLKALKISEISMILVASSQYVNNSPKVRTIENLADHRMIAFNKRFEKGFTLIKRGGKSQKIKAHSSMLANTPLFAKSFAMLNQGIALLPDIICYEEIKQGDLVRILPDWATESTPCSFVWPSHVSESAKVRAFVDFSKDLLRKYFITSTY